MGSEQSQLPRPGESTLSADDFQRIQGIGPVIERQLYDAGVLTYARLATLSPEQIARLIKNLPLLSVERIARQDWPGQARALAAESALLDPSDEAAIAETEPYSRCATFTIELLLDDSGQVRRTRVVHVQHGEEETWGGWDEDSLLGFVAAHATLEDPPVTTERAPKVAARYLGIPDLNAARPSRAIGPTELAGPASGRSPVEARAAVSADWPADRAYGELRLEIGEMTVDETWPEQQSSGQPPVPQVRAQLEFWLSGPGAAKVAAQAVWSTAQIVACDLASGESSVLAVGHSQLICNQLGYTSILEFALPDDGRYQLVGTVLIAEVQLVGSVLGPILCVVP